MAMDLNSLIISYNGDWDKLVEDAYQVFCDDFILSMPRFGKFEVDFVSKKQIKNKEETFWHVVSEDPPKQPNKSVNEEDRIPDIKRARRTKWIKEIIENYDDDSILMWLDPSFPTPRYHLWYNKEFLVVLITNKNEPYYRLRTAFVTKIKRESSYLELYKKYGLKKPMSPF